MSFGPHVSRVHAAGARPKISDHIEVARQEAKDEAGFEIKAVSIFVGGPQNRVINLREEERAPLKAYLARTGIRGVAHSSYTAPPWRGDPDAARYIREEAKVCQEAGLAGLVVHLPKLPAADVLKYLPRLLVPEAPDVRIYLEIPAVRPSESFYETPAKLRQLFRGIRANVDPMLSHFGLCFDSAHIWTCGQDLSTYEAADKWLRDLEGIADVLPPSHVMGHFNDSERPRGVGPDAHAPLALGKIWGEYRDNIRQSGLAAFVDYALRHDTVMILERKPKMLTQDYRILRGLVP